MDLNGVVCRALKGKFASGLGAAHNELIGEHKGERNTLSDKVSRAIAVSLQFFFYHFSALDRNKSFAGRDSQEKCIRSPIPSSSGPTADCSHEEINCWRCIPRAVDHASQAKQRSGRDLHHVSCSHFRGVSGHNNSPEINDTDESSQVETSRLNCILIDQRRS